MFSEHELDIGLPPSTFLPTNFVVSLLKEEANLMLRPIIQLANEESNLLNPFCHCNAFHSDRDDSFDRWDAYLAAFVGIDCSDVSRDHRRALIASAVRIYARRGTKGGLMEHLQIVLGLTSSQILIEAALSESKIKISFPGVQPNPDKVVAGRIINFHLPVTCALDEEAWRSW
jgi:phage tail-like protein